MDIKLMLLLRQEIVLNLNINLDYNSGNFETANKPNNYLIAFYIILIFA
jgi:hypothetical protein